MDTTPKRIRKDLSDKKKDLNLAPMSDLPEEDMLQLCARTTSQLKWTLKVGASRVKQLCVVYKSMTCLVSPNKRLLFLHVHTLSVRRRKLGFAQITSSCFTG